MTAPSMHWDSTFEGLEKLQRTKARKVLQGQRQSASSLEEELILLGSAISATGEAGDVAEVLAEMWEEVDEELVREVAALPIESPCQGEIPELPQADHGDVEAALREIGLHQAEWPVDNLCRSKCEAAADVAPVPTPCRAPPPSSLPAAEAPPAGSSFKSASQICPPRPTPAPRIGPQQHAAAQGPHSMDFDAASRAILQRQPQAAKAALNCSGSSGRQWSEAWLRIADPDQLERIVPALEATIHRAEGSGVVRKDIAGLQFVKGQIEEILILPRLHPELFASALTRPARGLLLFGPPGTGKTLLARWIAAECGATFFNINASSVLSKWIGEAEKTVKALFQLATDRQPSVIFIDEIDSLLSLRRDADNESSRRVKNEFLTSLEGAETGAENKVLLVGATNMPWELDPAALRRLSKRLYVPLPGLGARRSLLKRQLAKHNEGLGLKGELTQDDIEHVAQRTSGYSGSDLQGLLREAAMGPVRELASRRGSQRRSGAPAAGPRNISLQDFESALKMVKPGFSEEQEKKHRLFNQEHGTCRGENAMKDDDEEADEDDEEDVDCLGSLT